MFGKITFILIVDCSKQVIKLLIVILLVKQ